MSLQTAGQASQAQPKTYTLDSLPTASPATGAASAYYNGYSGEPGAANTTTAGYPQSLYPGGHQLSPPTQANYFNKCDSLANQPSSGKPQFNGSSSSSGVTSRLDALQHHHHQQQQQQQHGAMSALMMQSSPRKNSDLVNEQRLRTNSLGQVCISRIYVL